MSAEHTKQFIQHWDPLRLIADHHTSKDEYDREAFELFWWFKRQPDATPSDVSDHFYKMLVDWIGEESPDLLSACKQHATELYKALLLDHK